MTRAFGDAKYKFANEFKTLDYKTVLVTPEVREHIIDPFKDEFLVIASDGLYDERQSQEVVDFIRKNAIDNLCTENPAVLLNALMEDLKDREGKDDITIILVMLQRNL